MKKIISRLMCVALVVFMTFGFVACDKKIPEVAVSTTNVVSNGGPVAKQGNTLYFVNGFVAASETSNTYGKVTTSSLYKVVLKDNGEIDYGVDGQIGATQIVSSQVGFVKGSIYVYGDYVYYATPYGGKDNTGKVLYNYISFYRIKNDGTERKLICTTDTDDADMIYSYYVLSEKSVALVLFEQTSGHLTSYVVTNKVKQTVIDTDVSSVVLSENNGEGGNANGFVYYTKNVKETDEIQNGNKVYRVKPNGEDNALISTNRSIDIVTICNGFLVYEEGDKTHISLAQENLAKTDKCISNKKFETVLYVATTNGVSMIVVDTTASKNKVCYIDGADTRNNYVLYEDKATFIGYDSSFVYFYTSSNNIYKVMYTEAKNEITNIPTQICSTAVVPQGGTMVTELVDGYIYFFGTLTNAEDNTSKVMLYRVKTTNASSVAGEMVGVK